MVESKTPQLAASVDTSQVVLVIVYLVLIIVGAYFLTRFLAKRRLQQGMRPDRNAGGAGWFRQKSGNPQPGHMVCVVDRIVIDREKTLMVVEFEGKYFLIGTTPQGFKCFDKVKVPPAEAASEAEEQKIVAAAQAAAGTYAAKDSEETFGQRFRRAFSVVLESYLPKGVREKRAQQRSFEEELRARTHAGMKDDKDRKKPED